MLAPSTPSVTTQGSALTVALSAGLADPSPPDVVRLAAHIATVLGPATLAVVHYGSRAHGASGAGSDPRPESADDFFVIVSDYRAAYTAAVAAGAGTYRPGVAATLNHILPPNVIAITMRDGPPDAARKRLAKCAVLSMRDLERACSNKASDHFVRARLFQQVCVAWRRDDAAFAGVANAIAAARSGTFTWVRPYLPATFTADAYCRALFATSFAAEIRPEGAARVELLLGTQADLLVPMYDALLASLAQRGVLRATDGRYADPRPPGRIARVRANAFFRVSKARATARWAKYIALYDDWLDYVVQKVARRSGTVIALTPRERRWPLIFLWPKALRYLKSRPQQRETPRGNP